MLVYSIRQARHGRQISKIRAMSKAGAQQASVRKLLKEDSGSLTIMLQNERKHHTPPTNMSIPTQRVTGI